MASYSRMMSGSVCTLMYDASIAAAILYILPNDDWAEPDTIFALVGRLVSAPARCYNIETFIQ